MRFFALLLATTVSAAAVSPLSLSTRDTSSGCSATSPNIAPGSSANATIKTADGRTRKYIIHVPSTYKPGVKAPLILSFHGNGKTAAYQQALSAFDDEKWNTDAVVVYPQGVSNRWQGAPYSDASINDKAFIATLLDHLLAAYCIDAARIYASGKSLGGGFTHTLACSPSISHRFAAFAPVSGAFYTGNAPDGSDCHPEHAVTPILEFHGLADETIPYTGGEHNGVDLPDVYDWAAHWAARNGCGADKPETEKLFDGNVTHYTWGCGVQHYAIAGLGHDWPSKTPNGDNKKGTYLDATPLILDFFRQHVNELDGSK